MVVCNTMNGIRLKKSMVYLPVTDDVGDLKTLIDSILVSHFSDVLIMFVFSSVLVSITWDVMSAIK